MSIDIEDFEFAVADRFRHVLGRRRGVLMPPTPRALARLLTTESAGASRSASLTARAFYRIRATVARQLNIPSTSIRPGARCRDLLPDLATRRAQWMAIDDALRLHAPPRLCRSGSVAAAVAIFVGLVTLWAALASAATHTDDWLAYPSIAASGAVALVLALRVTRPWARYFHPPDLTVGALAHYAVAYGSPMLGDLTRPIDASQTLEVVQALVRLEFDVWRVNPDATWAELESRARAS